MKITNVKIEHTRADCITDRASPVVSFQLESDTPDTCLKSAKIKCGSCQIETTVQTGVSLNDVVTAPFSSYTVELEAEDNHGNLAQAQHTFRSGRLDTPWQAKWITDESLVIEKGKSPLPMTFRKRFSCGKEIRRAFITSTAIGVYELELNGKKIGSDYFAPGYTTYQKNLQYQLYDVTEMLADHNTLTAIVGGGWAVGRFTYASKNQLASPRQALLLELFLEYADGSKETIVTDSSWQVTEEGNFRWADFYDGEIYNAAVNLDAVVWKQADLFKPTIHPTITAQYGESVTAQEQIFPRESFPGKNGRMVYDFGQNFAGVVYLELDGTEGQEITIRHAEALFDGDICVNSNRTAKATAAYICREGKQVYSPRMTYMGFRYIEISGIEAEKVQVSALVLHSDFDEIGSFECSDERLNKLQNMIRWSGKSNFVDVPTDCPQRDERLGWTGDISIFSPAACFNFDLSRFFDKWLADVRAEQTATGGMPFVVPNAKGLGPSVPTACWGDCCILVPWTEYQARGDAGLLRTMYPAMKKYLKAVKFWAAIDGGFSRDQRRIWKKLFQFGDWNAPGKSAQECMARGPWVATAYYAYLCEIMTETAKILGLGKDSKEYFALRQEICQAYQNVFTDNAGTLLEEFQTGYVLPLAFGMVKGDAAKKMADNLDRLVRENDYHLSTGFTGTPFLLFALADNGHIDTAFRLLYQDTCPSWLYELHKGATTFWEGWDNIPEDAGDEYHCISDSGVSFNHYAYGAVGSFLYRRVLGLEMTEPGYKSFRICPLPGSGLSFCRGSIQTPYGTIRAEWKQNESEFSVTVDVPVSTHCTVILPSGQMQVLASGHHVLCG